MVPALMVMAVLCPTACSSEPETDLGCVELVMRGEAPVHQDDPRYRASMDRDGDGWACE